MTGGCSSFSFLLILADLRGSTGIEEKLTCLYRIAGAGPKYAEVLDQIGPGNQIATAPHFLRAWITRLGSRRSRELSFLVQDDSGSVL